MKFTFQYQESSKSIKKTRTSFKFGVCIEKKKSFTEFGFKDCLRVIKNHEDSKRSEIHALSVGYHQCLCMKKFKAE